MPISKVLIANRGEIAVRIARACTDVGIESVAVYADPDRNALHVKIADEAYALGGDTPGDSYLLQDKIIAVAKRAGADAIHPGYGFLSENATFAQAVLNAGLVWIGPPPAAIDSLGDKVKARHIAMSAGAPLVPGTKDPVPDSDAVVDFAHKHGLPVAIKAAFGGGGRGMRVARTIEEIPDMFEAAVREAEGAFGRGECFVERYLDKPRHVETQCLADLHGNVAVVSTRDCSLQRRHQKLVEEAPAPFLSDAQIQELVSSSEAILTEAEYVGAGTVEFLVGADGTISFLEVNTRLQVEHPVSEEITGVDLVREQIRIADGEKLTFTSLPPVRGHSFEFRINGEDPGRDFMPGPGSVLTYRTPSGPGVRVDSGVTEGDVISGAFDSMLAKLIVTGADRPQALARARRALGEFVIEGMPTALTFHRVVVTDPAFAPPQGEDFSVHTRWIETEFENTIEAYTGPTADSHEAPAQRNDIVVEVDGKRLSVSVPSGLSLGGGAAGGGAAGGGGRSKAPRRTKRGGGSAVASGDSVTAPMQGTVVKVVVAEGDDVAEGDVVLVIEAMKMEQPIKSHKSGTITGLKTEVGQTVTNGAVICEVT